MSTATTDLTGPPADPPGRRSRADAARLVARGLGQTLLTAGVVVLLFVVYEVWVTNLFAAHKQAAAHQQLEQSWASGQDPLAGSAATGATGTGSTGTGRLPLPGDSQSAIPVGTGIANLYIPRFGSDFAFTIVQGTDDASLEKGPGHYSGTALPGQLGNFAVAGHRVGKGEPFLNLDQLAPGDAVVVETKTQWFVYRVLGDPGTGNLGAVGADGVPGREIVSPSDAAVIDPVPSRPGATPTEQLMTMTTCHPKYTANQRLIVHAKLARTVARQGTALPRELSGGTL